MTSSVSTSSNSKSDMKIARPREKARAPEKLPRILDGKFFIYSEIDSTKTKMVAICTACRPKVVKISGCQGSTSNFVTHLKRRHGETKLKEYKSYLYFAKSNKLPSRVSFLQSETKDDSDETAVLQTCVSQEQFNDNIVKFFINSMIPLQAISDPYFKKMFESHNIRAKGLIVVDRQTLGRLIDDCFQKEMTSIRFELEDVKEVCTTMNIWTAETQNFLGVTAYWLDSELKRKSRTLACRSSSGTHSNDRIDHLLRSVHAEFGLDSRKVLATVTDNSTNFVKAFNEHGADMESDGDPLELMEHTVPQSKELELPAHLTCSAHKLNLCVTIDANKLLQNNVTNIAKNHNKAIKKCNNLWNSVCSPESAEIMQNIIGDTLSKPGITGWKSLYVALQQIASIQDKSAQLHKALGLRKGLRTYDFQYINEYLRCSKPIAEALDILQSKEDMYYGILLPCLLSLRKKLQKLNRESFDFCKKLAKKYLESVESRFVEFFDMKSKVAQNAAIAAMSYPRFKDKWIVCFDVDKQIIIKSTFKAEVVHKFLEAPATSQVYKFTPNIIEDSYFEFDTACSETDSVDMHVQQFKADDIINNYLADQDRDISMLNRYPAIKSIFRQYNTPLPTSGPGRLFSHTTMTSHSLEPESLADEMFEKRLLLKSNLNSSVLK